MEKKQERFGNFYQAWHFLLEHPIFQQYPGIDGFINALYIEVVKVDPSTNRIVEDERRNLATRVWLECGPWSNEKVSPEIDEIVGFTHDPGLNCGSWSFEEAIKKLAQLVLQKYGDYTREDSAASV